MVERFEDGPGHRVVRASAGTGKTHRLTGRYLALLAAGAPAGRVVATTFTRKAAAEVRDRVLRRLAEACLDDDPGARDRERAQLGEGLAALGVAGVAVDAALCADVLGRLVGELERVSIGTIDALLGRWSGVLAWELGRGERLRLVAGDDEAARRLVREAIEGVIDDAGGAGDGGEGFAGLVEGLRALRRGEAGRSVVDVMAGQVAGVEGLLREAPDAGAWSAVALPVALDEVWFRELLDGFADRFAGVLPEGKSGKPDGRWVKALGGVREGLAGRAWERVARSGFVEAARSGGAYYGREFEADFVERFAPVLELVRREALRPIALQGRAMHALGRAYVERLDAGMAAAGVVRFEDVTRRLAWALPGLGEAGREELFYRLDGEVDHLLIDEFQDTSLEQWAVLGPVAEELMSDATTGRSFFAVGDPKQAIYAWRGGRVELFGEAVGLAERYGGVEEKLDASQRSSAVVLNGVNRVFAALREDAEQREVWGSAGRVFAAGFEPHVQAERVAAMGLGGAFTVETSAGEAGGGGDESEGGDGEDAVGRSLWRPGHCGFVAGRVADWVAAAPGCSAAVLCRTRKAMRSMVHHLREDAGLAAMGLEVWQEGGQRLADEPAVQAVLSALRLAEREDDAAAAFHVSSGPMGEVVGLRGLAAARSRAARADAAGRVRRRLAERGVAGVLSGWAGRLAGACDARGADRLERLVAWARANEAGLDRLSPGRVVAAAEGAVVAAGGAGGVSVMTIHASKGLEFDLVVLPELDGRLEERLGPLVLREGGGACGRIEAVFPEVKKELRWLDPRFEAAAKDAVRRKRYDDLCTLYVAMTRARHALRVVLQPGRRKRNGEEVKEKSLGSLVHAAVAGGAMRATEAEVVHVEAGTDEGWGAGRAEGVVDTEVAGEGGGALVLAIEPGGSRGEAVARPSDAHGGDEGEASSEGAGERDVMRGSWALRRARHAARRSGTLMHAMLERVRWLDEAGGRPSAGALRAVLAEGGVVDADEVAEWLERFERLVGDAEVAELLGRSRDGWSDLHRELAYALSGSADAGQARGVFDRLMVARDGAGRVERARVVDFKTDRRPEGMADDAFAELLVARHGGQLRAYRSAAARLLGVDEAAVGLAVLATAEPMVVRVD
ncbi:MAG: UvrD-helicase domain-containing protein [Planctomycetota bacterium]